MLADELAQLQKSLGEERYAGSKFAEAGELFLAISTAEEFVEFLTLPAYERLE